MNLYVVTISLGYEEGMGIYGIFTEYKDATACVNNLHDDSACILVIPANTPAKNDWCEWPKDRK